VKFATALLLTAAAAAVPSWDALAQVHAAAYCDALSPLPSVPAHARRVTDYGAVPDDNLADDNAISAALNALQPGDWLVFTPGRYLQTKSIVITTPGVTVWGAGAHLHATNPLDHTVSLQADGVRLYGFKLTAVTDVRRSAVEQTRISIYRDWTRPGLQTGNVVRGNTVTFGDTPDTANSAGGAGILVSQASDFTVADNTVRRSLADGIHITGGSRNGRVINNTVRETGDDMIAVVSYLGKGWQQRLATDAAARGAVERGESAASNVLIEGNDLADNYWGRGIAVVGSRGITVRRNRIDHTAMGAGVLVAQEGGWGTPGPRNVAIQDNHITRVQNGAPTYVPAGLGFATLRGRVLAHLTTGHGAIEVHAIQNSLATANNGQLVPLLAVQDISITGNRISDTAVDGVRIGVDTAATLVQRVTVAGNTLQRVAGASVSNLLGASRPMVCNNNTRDTRASIDVGCVAPSTAAKSTADALAVGATLNCAALRE
jgi:parallel beta-helix repeat protein